jgi:hypothetical protein
MKNLKPIIYVILILLMITACTSDNDNLKFESQQIDYEKLNLGLKENLISFSKMVEYDKSLSNDIDEFLETGDESIFLKKDYQHKLSRKTIEDKVLYKKEDLSDVYSESQKEFLLNFYNELANCEDGNILDIVITYKDLLTKQNFTSEEFNQINIILVASEQSILILDDLTTEDDNFQQKSSFSSKSSNCGFWCCMRLKAGRAIGRGIVQGAIVGAISGGYYGAAGGTVILPGVGTTTGAVGGAVYGAAAGAVVGGVGNALWQAVDCGAGGGLKAMLEKLAYNEDDQNYNDNLE